MLVWTGPPVRLPNNFVTLGAVRDTLGERLAPAAAGEPYRSQVTQRKLQCAMSRGSDDSLPAGPAGRYASFRRGRLLTETVLHIKHDTCVLEPRAARFKITFE